MTMRMKRVQLIVWLCLLGANAIQGKSCPETCECGTKEGIQSSVTCLNGGLLDPIPVADVERDIEILRISAPRNVPNFLTIGPIFHKFFRLRELHIVRSHVPAIGKHSFLGLSKLQVLNLTENNISHIVEPNFKGLENLTSLHLDDNKIESMPSESFRYLLSLESLSLSGNRIRELVPRIFLGLGKLRDLDLSRNPLGALNPEVFKDVRGLRVFRCRSCLLTKLNADMFRLLVNLTELDLGENELKRLFPEPFYYPHKNLQILRLDRNQVSEIVGGSLEFSSLRFVDLSHNRLVEITDNIFVNVTDLRALNLSYNKLTRLESRVFSPLNDSLRNLDVSGNSISMDDLKYIIQIVTKLTHLSLADMQLSELPLGLFARHENLNFLNISGNRFSHVSPQVLQLMNRIQVLDLSKNLFRGLTEKVLVRLEKIPGLILKENPWACDLCHIPSLLNRAKKPELKAALTEAFCHTPRHLAGKPLSALEGGQLRWCTEGEEPKEGGVAGVLGGPPPRNLRASSPLALAASIGAAVTVVASIATCIAVARRRHRSDTYYTREESRCPINGLICGEKNGKAYENGKEHVSIAIIDEMATNPELQVFANGSA